MAISTLFFKKKQYYRITRTWDHRNIKIQKYVPFGTTKKQNKIAFIEAETIDRILTQQQQNDHLIKMNNGELYFHLSGKVIGINRVFNIRNSSPFTESHIFDIRYNPRRLNSKSTATTKHASVSIAFHGLQYAYELAVKKFAVMARIDENKPLLALMLASIKYYQFDPTLKKNDTHYNGRGRYDPNECELSERIRINFDAEVKEAGIPTMKKIESNLLKELENYQRKNPVAESAKSRNLSQW